MKKIIPRILYTLTLMLVTSTLFGQVIPAREHASNFVLYPSGEKVSAVRKAALVSHITKAKKNSTVSTATNSPVAQNDSVFICMNSGTVTIHVQNNDSDPNGDPLVTNIYAGVINGSFSLNGTAIDYAPNPGYTGTDTIVYYVCDGNALSLCDTAMVFIHVVTSFTTTNTVSICSGDSAFLAGAYQHLPATYTSTLTATGGCDSFVVTKLIVNPLPPAAITPNGPTTFCQGDSVTLTANSATSYVWSTGATTQSITVHNSGNYYVTVTNANSCSAKSSTTTVTVLPAPSITITPSSAGICTNTSVSLTASGASSYSWAPAAGLSATTGSVVTANPAGTSTYTVKGSNGTCIGTQTIVITVTPAPTISIAPSSTTICSNGSSSLTAIGATTYTWSPATGLSATSGSVVTANPANTTTYTVTGSNGSCSATQTTVVTVKPVSTPTITPGSSTTFCQGGTVMLTSSTATSYSWSTGATTQSITVTASGNYSVTVSDGTSCSATSANTSVTVNPLPVISITPSSSAICTDASVSLTASGALSYSWSPGASLSTTTGSVVTASPANTATYTVMGTSGTCVGTQTAVVTIITPPTITISPASPSICVNGSSTLTAGGAISYTWFPASGLSSTTGSVVTATPSNTTTYTAIGSNGTCSGAQTVVVTIMPVSTPTITSGSSTTFCKGGSVILTSSTATSYTWSTGANTQSITTDTSGSYSVTVSNSMGCSVTSANTSVTVNPLPPITINPSSAAICTNTSVSLTASGALTYSWLPVAGLNATTGSEVTANPANTSTYTVSGSNGTCTGTQTVVITVSTAPNISIVPSSNTICPNGSANLTANGATSYTWSPATGLSATTGSVVTVNPVNTTTYVVNGSNGTCSATQSVVVTVKPLSTPTITSNNSTIFCQGDSVKLSSSPETSYLWSTGDTTQSITVHSSGNYSVVVSNGSCSASSTITPVTVKAVPVALITANDTTVFCQGDSVKLSSSAGTSYLWSTGGTTQSITVHSSGNYTVSVTGANGCTASSATSTVTVQPLPTAVFSSTLTAAMTYSFINTSINATSYLWDFGNGNTSATINPGNAYATAGTYTVSLIATNSCGSNKTEEVLVINAIPDVAFYDGFSPNGDGRNDTWTIPMLTDYPNNRVHVVNRWGSEVWRGDNYNNTSIVWDGKNMTGDDLPDGTYYYVISYNNTHKNGWVIIKR
jgi:gliding motility-associated-like protein